MSDGASKTSKSEPRQTEPEKPTGSVEYCKAKAHLFVTTAGNAIIEVLLLSAKSFSRDGSSGQRAFLTRIAWGRRVPFAELAATASAIVIWSSTSLADSATSEKTRRTSHDFSL